ncbi:hypothetical protein [Flavobacterium sp. GCM10027622]|uniref:hypothetical protein n=1 Tax=unclassified Flavobacterium TaxID=196869 RepID=UPI0036219A6E
MKRKLLGSFLIFLALESCQKEDLKIENSSESNFVAFQKKWKEAELNSNALKIQGNSTCYLFSKETINGLLLNTHVVNFRFVLGLTNEKLDIKVQGVDLEGVNRGVVNSIISNDRSVASVLKVLHTSTLKSSSNRSIVGQHLLEPKVAFDYINKWNTKLKNATGVEDVVSYDMERIRHFSIEKEVITEIAKSNGFKYLGVFFGINPEGKLTTVLVGLDENKNIILPSSLSRDASELGGVYDFTKPCPNTCDPGSSLNRQMSQ